MHEPRANESRQRRDLEREARSSTLRSKAYFPNFFVSFTTPRVARRRVGPTIEPKINTHCGLARASHLVLMTVGHEAHVLTCTLRSTSTRTDTSTSYYK